MFFLDQLDKGLERIKEVKETPQLKEKKIRRFTEEIETYSPKAPKSKEVILDLINLEEKSKVFKMKRLGPEIKNDEEKKKQGEGELEDSKNSVNNLQKSFRIRNRRSTSDIRENSVQVGKTIDGQRMLDNQKRQINFNITNKHLLHNKMQKRPDTTGAKNRDKKFVIIEKTKQNLNATNFNSNSNEGSQSIKKANTLNSKFNQESNEKNRPSLKKEEVLLWKEKFKEEFIEKMKFEKEEGNNHNNNPLDIKKEFSTDLFDEFKFGELLGEGSLY